MKKAGRNDPCPCGSGKKYKQCCLPREEAQVTKTRPAAKSTPISIEAALEHHEAGRLPEAEAIYRQVLATDPTNFDALHLLGVITNQSGKSELAAGLIGQALLQQPQHPFALNNLGLALQALAKLDEAAASYRKALSSMPDFADAHYNLGNVLLAQNKPDEAVASYQRALALQPDDAEAHNNLGSALRNLGRADEAVACYRKALSFRPDYAEALNNLGATLHEQGKPEEAIAALNKAISIQPNHVEATNNLGVVFWKEGKLDDAVACYRKALSLKPDYAEGYDNLGSVLQTQGKFEEAIANFRKALSIKPDYAKAHSHQGNALRMYGHLDEAVASLRRALTLDPGLIEAHTGLADVYIDMGQFDTAQASLSKALEFEPEHPHAWAMLASLRKMTPQDGGWLNTALRLAASPTLSLEEKVTLQFALGKYYDDTGQYDLAFPAYQQANSLKRQMQGKFDRTGFSRMIDDLIATYNADFMNLPQAGANSSELPVLIVGMLRSGTSLTEQIIASHPDAYGAGELAFWGNWLAANQAAALSGSYGETLVADTADAYEQYLRNYSADALRIVDKMPGNFLLAGLIHLIFPQARIIHTRRNPIDTCLSVYFQNLLPAHSYATDLDDLAFYYREYDRLMQHWRKVLPADRFLEISYEALTNDQSEWSRRIIEFIGLEWDERCLNFHTTERKVGTMSNWQVRQKIYHSSKARWRNYEKHLGPLLGLRELEDISS